MNGDGQYLGFLMWLMTIAEQLLETCQLLCRYLLPKLRDNESAIDHLSSFSADDEMISSIALGSMGDAYMNLGDSDQAILTMRKLPTTVTTSLLLLFT